MQASKITDSCVTSTSTLILVVNFGCDLQNINILDHVEILGWFRLLNAQLISVYYTL